MYHSAALGKIVTIRFPSHSGRFATCEAAHAFAPALIPTANPSSFASARSAFIASDVGQRITSSISSIQTLVGKNDGEIPCIPCGPGLSPFNRDCSIGSTAIHLKFGFLLRS